MSFLRRILGRREEDSQDRSGPVSDDEVETAEREYEREVLRSEAERLDELRQRQLRYADRAWTPAPQGGDRRADDEDAARDS